MPEPGDQMTAAAPSRFVRWYDAHPFLTDTALAVAVMVIGVLLDLMPLQEGVADSVSKWLPPTIVVWVLCGAAVAARRRRPVVAWALVTFLPALNEAVSILRLHLGVVDASYLVSSLNTMVMLGTPLVLAVVASTRPQAQAWLCCLVSSIVGASEVLVLGVPDVSLVLETIGPYLLLDVIGTLIGLLVRFQRFQVAELQLRAERLRLAQEQEAALAAATERSRIAREMHDVLAHSLAVMVTVADGAKAALDRDPEMTREALEVLSETGRSALADTRRLVGVLRDDPGATSDPAARASLLGGAPAPAAQTTALADTGEILKVRTDLPVPEFAPPGTVVPKEPSEEIEALRREETQEIPDLSSGTTPLAPAPAQSDLSVLVRRFRAAGVPVDYEWEGDPLPEDRNLQLTLFRIAQEALTNVLRYAPTTRLVAVRVVRDEHSAVLTVDNDAAAVSAPIHGSGKGLIGMRERAAVYNGTVDAGPTATGWRVRATLRWDDDEGSSPWQK